MAYRAIVLPRARRDVDSILQWILDRSIDGALRWVEQLERTIESLEFNPESCGIAAEDGIVPYELRERFFKTRRGRKYRLIFTIVGDEVRVLRVRGSGQRLLEPDELQDSNGDQ